MEKQSPVKTLSDTVKGLGKQLIKPTMIQKTSS